MFSKKSLVKSVSVLSSATFLSRILGFVRDILIAKIFGTGWIIQSFFVAFKLPNIFRDLVGEGASNSVFVPVFSEYLVKKKKEEFWKFVNTALLLVLFVNTLIVIIGVIAAPVIVRVIAPGFSAQPDKLNLTITLTRFILPYLLFMSCVAFMMGVLNSFKVFLPSALSPSIFNICLIIAIILASNSRLGIGIIVIGIFVAGFLQILLHIPYLSRKGFRFWPFNFHREGMAHPGIRKISKLLIPRIAGSAIYHINILVDTIFASLSFLVGQGAIAAIYYANRMIQFPLGIFGVSIRNASLPTLSEFAAKKEMDKFAHTVEFSLSSIIFVMLPATFGLMLLSKPIIQTIFERGAFTAESTLITSTALTFYALGLCAFSANKFIFSCFFAMQDTVTPVKFSIISLVLNIIFNILFVVLFRMEIAGLAFASSISAAVSLICVSIILKKKVPLIKSRAILFQSFLMLLASLVMVAVIYYGFHRMNQFLSPATSLLITIIVGIIVYFFVCLMLSVRQAREACRWLLRKR